MPSIHTKRLYLNLSLLVVVLILGAIVWWQVSKPLSTAPSLLALTKADINHITIKRNLDKDKPETIRLVKQAEQWRMLEPKNYAVNPIRMAQLFTLLDEPVEASYPAQGKDLKTYGLQPGKVELSFNDQALILGDDNPVSHKRYILHQGSIKLVSEAVVGLLQGDVLDLLSTKLVPPERTLQQVTLPDTYAKVAPLLQNWRLADAIQIEAWDGKGESKGQIVLSLDDGSQVNLSILNDQDEFILGNTSLGLRYKLVPGQMANLLPKK